MKHILSIMFALALGACASEGMQARIGSDINEVIMDKGPPANIIELSKDKRAYQWIVSSTVISPTTSYTTNYGHLNGSNNIQLNGDNAYSSMRGSVSSNSFTQTSGASISEDTCIYTLLGGYNRQRKAWIVTGFRKPDFLCE